MVRPENRSIGIKCIKCLLYLSNFLFILTALLIISIGTTIYAFYTDFERFLQAEYFSPALSLITIGFLMLIVSLFGIVGTAKESTCMVTVFSAFSAFILIFELCAAITAYSLPSGISMFISHNLDTVMQNYYTKPEDAKSTDFLQINLNCCGINGPDDWKKYYPGSNNSHYLPDSCRIGHNIRTEGCLEKLETVVYASSLMVGTGALSVALVQALGMAFSCLLAKSIRQAKTEREIRRNEMRSNILNSDHYTQMHQGSNVQMPITYTPGSSEA